MAKNKLIASHLLVLSCIGFMMFSCSYMDRKVSIPREISIPEGFQETKAARPTPPTPPIPEFVPVVEDITLLKTRNINISARNTPLRDVLFIIAEATNMNIAMEKEVDDEIPVTLTLKNISALDALEAIFSSADYFYNIKDNVITVRTVDTKMYELGNPAVLQDYRIEVGGDILGSGQTLSAAGGSSSSGSTIKGSVSKSVRQDEQAFKFWDGVERSLGIILGVRPEQIVATAGQEQTRRQAGTVAQPAQQQGDAQLQAGAAPSPTTLGPPPRVRQSFAINRLTGTVMVTATRRNLEKVDRYLTVVRKVINRQVLIEAKVIEVTLSTGFQFGIDWTLVDKYITNIADTAATRVTSSFQYGTNNFFNSLVPAAGAGANPVFTINGNPSFGGARANLQYVVNALESQGEIRTLANPKLNILNGQTALLSVGRNTNFISKVETTTTTGAVVPTTTFSVTTAGVLSGIMIGIVPFIDDAGDISLSITPIVSRLVKLEDKNLGTVGTNTIMVTLPTVDLRELSTTVKVRDGDLVVIGGLIQKAEEVNENKVPFLADVPLLKYFFTSSNKTLSKTELVLLLQPALIAR
jgi:MSHA type pilus biogenesis protein MshL